MRFERKYRIENVDISFIKHLVKMHPAGFRKAYPDRRINNIYLDTPDFETYRANVAGVSERKKYRVRWYGHELSQMKKPTFEIKYKQNQVGIKFSKKLIDFSSQSVNLVLPTIQRMSPDQSSLVPVLVNTYDRSYYMTSDKKFRITIDWDMRFGNFQTDLRHLPYKDENGIVLELKYDAIFEKESDRITQHIPFRLTKNSKYVNGVSLVMDVL